MTMILLNYKEWGSLRLPPLLLIGKGRQLAFQRMRIYDILIVANRPGFPWIVPEIVLLSRCPDFPSFVQENGEL